MTTASRAFWDSQLQNSVTIPEFETWPPRFAALSEDALAHGTPEREATGDHPMQALWRTATGRESHRLIFVHGGYWRAFSAADFHFPVATAKAADALFANVDYRLLPDVRMADAVADTVEACERAAQGAERAVIVGHSAGGHLALEAALRMRSPPDAVVSISGLFDLAPLRSAFIQEELLLTAEEVAAFSPQTRAAALACPVHLIAGADETVEFRRQSAAMHDAITDAGGKATLHFEPGCHHTSVVAELADPLSPLSRYIAALVRDS